MKPTQITELFANIKGTFVSFFSILMFVALGVGIFLGISWSGPALQEAADRTFAEGEFHNFQVSFPYGLTEDNLNELSKVEGVSRVEGAYQSYQNVMVNGSRIAVKVQSMGSDIDKPLVVEGELPTKANEIALHEASASTLGAGVGDTITFEKDANKKSGSDDSDSEDKDGMAYLNGGTYKVTAIINSPDYIAKAANTYGSAPTPSGEVDALAWVPRSAFDASAFQDGYPIVNVRSESLDDKNTFSDNYKKASNEIEARITELGSTLAKARYDDLHGQAQKKIDDAQAEIDDGKQKVADGEKKIADGEKEIADGRAELDSKRAEGQAELNSVYAKLINAQAEYDAGYAEYSSFKGEYDSMVASVNASQAQIDALIAELAQVEAEWQSSAGTEEDFLKYMRKRGDIATRTNAVLAPWKSVVGDIPEANSTNVEIVLIGAAAAFENAYDTPIEMHGQTTTLNEAGAQLNETKAKLDSTNAEIQSGWSQYYAKQAEFDAAMAEGEQKLTDAEQEIESAKADINDAKAQIAENEPKLKDAQAELDEMGEFEWTVMPRKYNAGASETSVFSDVTNNLSISMAALFIIVGLLVSYSAVSRIVHEQITQIGTKKALGLRAKEITLSFLWYSGIAVLAGAIIGTIVGVTLVEGIIGGVLSDMFAFGGYPPHFDIVLFLAVTLLELGLILGTTWFACRGILKKHAVELLRGPEPPKAKTRFYEKWGIWERLPLFTQTIVNNCVNDKRRVFSTVVGVAGCTALIVTAITLNNDVLKSYDKHYNDVYNFNMISFVETDPSDAINKAEATLKDKDGKTAQAVRRAFTFEEPDDGGIATIQMIVPMNADAFFEVYHINTLTGDAVDFSQDGAWVTEAYAKHLGAKVGDDITISDSDGTEHQMKILGFYEFYLTYHEMVINRDFYEREFGTDSEPNVIFSDSGDATVTDLESSMSSIDGFDSVTDDKTYQYGNFATFSSVSSAVVAIYLALAILMAVVVLLNLNVMFIDEKKRELIVLMINGFSVKDAKKYIYNDSIVLTAIGIICGLILGCIMGSITVAAIEPSTGVFVKDVDLMAVIAGIVGSAVLAVIMSMIALRRIPKFELTDINKF